MQGLKIKHWKKFYNMGPLNYFEWDLHRAPATPAGRLGACKPVHLQMKRPAQVCGTLASPLHLLWVLQCEHEFGVPKHNKKTAQCLAAFVAVIFVNPTFLRANKVCTTMDVWVSHNPSCWRDGAVCMRRWSGRRNDWTTKSALRRRTSPRHRSNKNGKIQKHESERPTSLVPSPLPL